MMKTAAAIEKLRGTNDELFDKSFIMVHNTDGGYIPQEFLEDKPLTPLTAKHNSLYNSGNLTMENNYDVDDDNSDPGRRALISGMNTYADCNSILKSVCNMVKGDDALNEIVLYRMTQLEGEIRMKVIEEVKKRKKSSNSNIGIYVSSHSEVDDASKAKRLKSITEPNRNNIDRRKPEGKDTINTSIDAKIKSQWV